MEIIMTKKVIFLLLLLILFLLLFVETASAQYQVPSSVISSGGERISSANYILTGTIGEPFTGVTANASNQNYAGFWYVYNQSTISGVGDEETIPTVYKLEQNYPNPFNPATIIKFGIPETGNVLLKIYDILGCEVLTLVNGEMNAGWYKISFDASHYSTGIYIYRMEAGTYISTKKMLLVK
jgi:hypothetical protein